MSNAAVDIIIPVYNAYDSLVKCVDSIIKYTNLETNRIVLIDDSSSDQRIRHYMDIIVESNSSGIVVLRNDKNLGFPASANRGMGLSNNDVVLLNSDTIVTKNWLDKLIKCAYSDKSIGTVTPLSNNGSICSIPNPCQNNELPGNLSIDEYAQLVERYSLKEYPRIPVAVGFCVYVKRCLINSIGYFNVELFKRGYGEELDFCFRAEQNGYIHVLSDDTFIYHEGTASFSDEEKENNIKESEKILFKHYKKQMKTMHNFWLTAPNLQTANNIKTFIKYANGKRNILYLLQADFRTDASNNIGGTQFHVKDLVMAQKDKYNIFVAARDGDFLRLTAYIEKNTISYKFYIGPIPEYNRFFDNRHSDLYKNILNAFCIDMVHIHHTYGLTLDLFYVAKDLEIPILLTLHDYYYACPSIKLLDHEDKLCIGSEKSESCKKCLYNMFGISEAIDFLGNWRNEHRKVLTLCDKILVPSNSAKEIMLRYYPNIEERIQVIEHGSDPYKLITYIDKADDSYELQYNIEGMLDSNSRTISGWCYINDAESSLSRIFAEITDKSGAIKLIPASMMNRPDIAQKDKRYLHSGFSIAIPPGMFEKGTLKIKLIVENEGRYVVSNKVIEVQETKEDKSRKLNVAFIGGLSVPKGSQMACKLIKNGPKHINWFIFGGIGDYELSLLSQDNLYKTSWYKREDLPNLFSLYNIDLVCILPIWHETFCYTLSEVLLCGVPVVVSDLGALSERVRALNCGWIVPSDASCKDILDLLESLINNQSELKEKRNYVNKLKLRSIDEMVTDYQMIYESLFKADIKYQHFDIRKIFEGYKLANNMNSISDNDMLNRLNMMEQELRLIKSSAGYKALQEIGKMKVPFKKQLKTLMFSVYKLLKRVKS